MIFLPAVDVRGGRAVRLRQGRFDDEKVYADDPLAAARSFVEAGAAWLHVVDLDGARDGEPRNLRQLERIAGELGVPVQYGGGLRSMASMRAALGAGAERVVIGTAALSDPQLLDGALAELGARVLVAIDVREGRVSVAGWTEGTGLRPEEAIGRMQERGAERFVYTSVDRDGTLAGVDLEELRRVADAIAGSFLLSGGVASVDDLHAVRSLRLAQLEGVIAGKALYEGRFSVAEARAALEGGG